MLEVVDTRGPDLGCERGPSNVGKLTDVEPHAKSKLARPKEHGAHLRYRKGGSIDIRIDERREPFLRDAIAPREHLPGVTHAVIGRARAGLRRQRMQTKKRRHDARQCSIFTGNRDSLKLFALVRLRQTVAALHLDGGHAKRGHPCEPGGERLRDVAPRCRTNRSHARHNPAPRGRNRLVIGTGHAHAVFARAAAHPRRVSVRIDEAWSHETAMLDTGRRATEGHDVLRRADRMDPRLVEQNRTRLETAESIPSPRLAGKQPIGHEQRRAHSTSANTRRASSRAGKLPMIARSRALSPSMRGGARLRTRTLRAAASLQRNANAGDPSASRTRAS